MVPWKKTLTIPSLRKNDHRTGLFDSHKVELSFKVLAGRQFFLDPWPLEYFHGNVSYTSQKFQKLFEGTHGFEPWTYRTAADCSTTELYPQGWHLVTTNAR